MKKILCEDCKAEFCSGSRLKRHRADFHQIKLIASLPGIAENVEILRTADGAWCCPCGHKESNHGCTDRMRRHLKVCKNLLPASEKGITASPEGPTSPGFPSATPKGTEQKEAFPILQDATRRMDERLEIGSGEGLDPQQRCIKAFILRTKWHTTVGQLDPELIESYVSKPSGDSVKHQLGLYRACRVFLDQIDDLERSTPFLILRFLGPQGDGSKPGRDPFRAVQEDRTKTTYADYLGRLVLMVWRKKEEDRFKVMPAIQESLLNTVSLLSQAVQKESPSDIVQGALRNVLKEIFCVPLGAAGERDDHVVSQYVMLRNVGVKRGWAGPEQAGQAVAALSYACRSTILARIREERPNDEEMKVLFQLVSTESNTPFCALQDLMRIAAYTQGTEWAAGPKVVWSTEHPAWTTLTVGSDILNLEDFADGLKELYAEASRILTRDLMLDMKFNEDQWNQVVEEMSDNLRETSIGYSLFHKRCNPTLAKMQDALLRHMCSSSEIYGEFFSEEPPAEGMHLPWKEKRLQKWCEKANAFVDCLIALIHVLGGGPARAEELATLAILNTRTGMRNVYWMHGAIMVLTTYHKSQNVIGRGRPVARFLPRLISDLVLKYITLVKPLESIAAGILYGGEKAEDAHRTYLFARRGRRMGGKNICSSFSLTMHRVVGFGLKFSDYRHLYTTLAKYFMGDVAKQKANLPFHEQAAHSAQTGEYTYGITSSDHLQITANGMLLFWRCSNEWHALFYFERSKPEWDVPPSLGKRKREVLDQEPASVQYDRSLPFSLKATHDAGMKEILSEWSNSRGRRADLALSRCNLGPTESGELLKSLRCFLGDAGANFLSRFQIQAVREVLRRRNDLLIVMPTGSGKSLAYMLPVWLESKGSRGTAVGVTIVVVPLVALMKEIRRRFEARGISVGEWGEREQRPVVLLVSVELTDSLNFLSYISRLAASGGLARIVVEEAHVRITWERFRPKLRGLGVMRPAVGVPLVLLTGTLPPCLETEMAIKFGSPFSMIRMSTSRPNLSYRVTYLDKHGSNDGSYTRNHVHAAVLRTLGKYKEALEGDSSRAIVYCATRSECMAVLRRVQSAGFSASSYHRGMESEEREASDREWRGGKSKIMVATSAFGTGIDFAGVRLVVHVGHSSSILDYAQETGRAGRDGQLGVCVTLAHKQYSLDLMKHEKKVDDLKDEARLVQKEEDCVFAEGGSSREKCYRRGLDEFFHFISPGENGELSKCRRQELQKYLDGEGDNCLSCGADFALCDVCERVAGSMGEASVLTGAPSFRDSESPLFSPVTETRISNKLPPSTPPSLPLSERPSRLVRDAGIATQKRRSQVEEALSRACQSAGALGEFCVLCSVMNGKLTQHQSARECVEGRRRCLRCYGGHSVRYCVIPRLGGKGKGVCYKCGVRHRGILGRECSTGLEHARSALLAVWGWKRDWLNKSFEQCRSIGSLEAFDKWLYEESSDYEPLRLVEVFNRWWAAFLSDMD